MVHTRIEPKSVMTGGKDPTVRNKTKCNNDSVLQKPRSGLLLCLEKCAMLLSMMFMRKQAPIPAVVFLILGAILLIAFQVSPQKDTVDSKVKETEGVVRVGNTYVAVWLARTEEERVLGLSGSSSLPKDTGMLFIFEASDMHGFWMKDMQYPIDIIWIDDTFSIVSLKENASPDEYPQVYFPETKARYVLEVKAGFIKEAQVAKGQKVEMLY